MKKVISHTTSALALLATLSFAQVSANTNTLELNQLKNSSAQEEMIAAKKSTLASELEFLETLVIDKLTDLDNASVELDDLLNLLSIGDYPMVNEETLIFIEESLENIALEEASLVQNLIRQAAIDAKTSDDSESIERLKLQIEEIRYQYENLSRRIGLVHSLILVVELQIGMSDFRDDLDLVREKFESSSSR